MKEVLEFPDEKRHFEQGYRRFGERYWGALNKWLEGEDGLRGLPTAVAVGHRYVGLPISQVLVREADRERLPHFFIYAGFPPGAVVPPQRVGARLRPMDSARTLPSFSGPSSPLVWEFRQAADSRGSVNSSRNLEWAYRSPGWR